MRTLMRTASACSRAAAPAAEAVSSCAPAAGGGSGVFPTRPLAASSTGASSATLSAATVTVPSRAISTAERDYLYGPGGADPTRRPKVDARITAMQVMGSESTIRADSAPLNSAAERRVSQRLDWVRDQLQNTVYFASFTSEQVEDLDEAFQAVRFAAPAKLWHDVMNMWYHWGAHNPDGDPALAAQRVDGYFRDLVNTTSQGVWKLSCDGRASSPYPANMLRFSLRPTLSTFNIAMRAHAAAKNPARVRAVYDLLLQLRGSIPDPAAEPAPTQPPGPELEKELLRRRLNAQHRSDLAPAASTHASAVRAALQSNDHEFMDRTVARLATVDRALQLTEAAHLDYMESLARRGMHWAVVEYMRVTFLHQPLRRAPAHAHLRTQSHDTAASGTPGYGLTTALVPADVGIVGVAPGANTALPSWLVAPADGSAAPAVSRSPFPPSRAQWLLVMESLQALHSPSAAERAALALPTGFPHAARAKAERHHARALAQSGAAPGAVLELDAGVRQWLYGKLAAHGLPVEAAFYKAMLQHAPTPAHVVSYVNDLHAQADALHARATAEPATAAETAAEAAAQEARRKLVVDLNTPSRDAAFRRVFGRYADVARARGVAPPTYEVVHERLVDLLVFELSRASAEGGVTSQAPQPAALRGALRESIQAYAQYLADNVRKPGDPASNTTTAAAADAADAAGSAVVSVADARAGAPATVSGVSVRAPAVPHKAIERILSRSGATAALLSLAGSPAAAQLLEHVMEVRKCITAYGVATTSDTNTAYIRALVLASRRGEALPPLAVNTATSVVPVVVAPVRVRVRAAVEGEERERVLASVRDRVQFAHSNIVRRHAQLQLVADEAEMLEAAGATLDLQLDCELIEALAELGTDAALLRGPFDAPARAPGASAAEANPDAVEDVEAAALLATADTLRAWTTDMLRATMTRLVSRALVAPAADLQHVSLLGKDGAATVATYLPLLRVLAAHGAYEELLQAVAAVHERRGLVPTQEVFNLMTIACINGNAPGRALRVLDLMALMTRPGQLAARGIDSAELSRAITAGNTADLVADKLTAVSEVFPDEVALSLLLRALHQKGLLQHAEELWRRLAHRPPSSWTSYSAVEEQQALAEALAEHEERELRDVAFDDGAEALLLAASASASEGEYDDAYNPAKNPVIRKLQTITPAALQRPLASLLPEGARRALPAGTQLLLDAPADAAMAQTFIQLGHPMHALQLYLDARAGMPQRPLPDPTAGALAGRNGSARAGAAAKLKELDPESTLRTLVPNTNLHTTFTHTSFGDKVRGAAVGESAARSSGDADMAGVAEVLAGGSGTGEDPLEQLYAKDSNALIDVSRMLPSLRRVPLPRERESRRLSALLESSAAARRVRPRGHDVSGLEADSAAEGAGDSHPLLNYYWPQADLLAAVVLYYQRTARGTVTRAMAQLQAGAAAVASAATDGLGAAAAETAEADELLLSTEVAKATLQQAEAVVALSQRAMTELRDFALAHPYVLGDAVTDMLYATPRPGSIEADMQTCVFSRPALLVPYVDATAELYRTLDELALAAVAMEESLFKARAAKHSVFGLRRWLAIFPAVANQARALLSAHSRKEWIQGNVDRLRRQIDASIRQSLRARRDALKLAAHERALLSVPKSDADSSWVARFSQFLGVQDADAIADIFLPAEPASTTLASAAAQTEHGATASSAAAAAAPSASEAEASASAAPAEPEVDPLAALMASLTAANAPTSALTAAHDVWTASSTGAGANAATGKTANKSAGAGAGAEGGRVWNPLGPGELPIPLADQAVSASVVAHVARIVSKQKRAREDARVRTSLTEYDEPTQAALFMDVREPSVLLQPLRAEGVFHSPYGPEGKGGLLAGQGMPYARASEAETRRRAANAVTDPAAVRTAGASAGGMYVEERVPTETSPLTADVDPRPVFSEQQLSALGKYKSGRLAKEVDLRPTPSFHISDLKLGQTGAARAVSEQDLERLLLEGDAQGLEVRADKPLRGARNYRDQDDGDDGSAGNSKERVMAFEERRKTGVQAFRERTPGRALAKQVAEDTRSRMVEEYQAAAQQSAGAVQWERGLGARGGLEAEERERVSRTGATRDGQARDRGYNPVNPFGNDKSLNSLVHEMRGAGKKHSPARGNGKLSGTGGFNDAWASAAPSAAFEQIKQPMSKVMRVKEKLERKQRRSSY